MQWVGGALVFSEPTTGRSRPTVPPPPVTPTALRAHRAAQAGEGLKARTAWQDSGLVFKSHLGTVVDPRNLDRLLENLCPPRAGAPVPRPRGSEAALASISAHNDAVAVTSDVWPRGSEPVKAQGLGTGASCTDQEGHRHD